jgi:hypothetical protein
MGEEWDMQCEEMDEWEVRVPGLTDEEVIKLIKLRKVERDAEDRSKKRAS